MASARLEAIVSLLPTKETTKIRGKSAGNIAAAQTDGLEGNTGVS